MATDDDFVRLNLFLPPEEREAFERWAAWGGKPKLSMTDAARELFRAAIEGKAKIDRERALKLGRSENRGKPRPKPAR